MGVLHNALECRLCQLFAVYLPVSLDIEDLKVIKKQLDDHKVATEDMPVAFRQNNLSNGMDNIYVKGEGCVLSMFSPFPIMYKGTQYKSPEHAYQCAKAEASGAQEESIETISNAPDAAKAKQNANEVHVLSYNSDWVKRKRDILKNICRARLDQDSRFCRSLQSTGDARIIHNVPNSYWGTGTKVNPGANTHGKILYELRRNIAGYQKTGQSTRNSQVQGKKKISRMSQNKPAGVPDRRHHKKALSSDHGDVRWGAPVAAPPQVLVPTAQYIQGPACQTTTTVPYVNNLQMSNTAAPVQHTLNHNTVPVYQGHI